MMRTFVAALLAFGSGWLAFGVALANAPAELAVQEQAGIVFVIGSDA